ncbi:SLAP domain-containing protein [Brevibacillus ginsengisoli]|uniref:SLAP domain-containing protein n=1 Tax=Brevibacillus ginsengisoli TaxID=363854 RepID=UPI003CF1F5C9
MSWLLENWFGSKDDLEEVREEVHENLQMESYFGVSGIDNPEQSSNRISSKDLFLTLHGEWESRLQDTEIELLQFIHDELPPIVRNEVGIIPFFTNVLNEGYLVLTFIRNAADRDVSLNKLPLSLVDPNGNVVATKTFDMAEFGGVGDLSSRPCDFMFRWEEFMNIPEEEVPLRLVYQRPERQDSKIKVNLKDGLTTEEKSRYEKIAQDQVTTQGEVEIFVLGVNSAEEGGLRVAVLFHNGLDKSLEFTEVPVILFNSQGEEVSRLHFGLKNLKVLANSSRIWGFHIPADSMKRPVENPEECKVVIPKAKPDKPRDFGEGSNGLIQ